MFREITVEELEKTVSPKRIIDIRNSGNFDKGSYPFLDSYDREGGK